MPKSLKYALVGAITALTLLVAPGTTLAHQTTVANGVTVRIHVTPDDEPRAGEVSKLVIVYVKKNGWTFKQRSAHWAVTNSSGSVLYDAEADGAKTKFTFPSAGAYGVTLSGRVVRNGKKKRFSAAFAFRAY